MTGWQDDQMNRWLDDMMTGSFADDWPYGIFYLKSDVLFRFIITHYSCNKDIFKWPESFWQFVMQIKTFSNDQLTIDIEINWFSVSYQRCVTVLYNRYFVIHNDWYLVKNPGLEMLVILCFGFLIQICSPRFYFRKCPFKMHIVWFHC